MENPTEEEIRAEFTKNLQGLYTKENPLRVRAGTIERVKAQRPDLCAEVDALIKEGIIIEDKN